MEYKIEKKDAFRIVGVKEHLDMNVEESLPEYLCFGRKPFRLQVGFAPTI